MLFTLIEHPTRAHFNAVNAQFRALLTQKSHTSAFSVRRNRGEVVLHLSGSDLHKSVPQRPINSPRSHRALHIAQHRLEVTM